MIKNDGGGGVQFFDFMGGHSCYEGDIELMGGVPPLEKTLEKYDLQMLSLCYNPNTIYIYIYCFQRISQNIKANKPTRSCEFPCQPFVWLQTPPNVLNKTILHTKS